MTDFDQRVSDQLVRLVQIIFALVIAQSLLLYRNILVHPFSHGNWLAALALGTVYLTTVLSWIDWHIAMENSPYNFNPRNPTRLAEQTRLGADLLVVTIYAYLLFSVDVFASHPTSEQLWRYLLGYSAVFAAYALSGLLRRITHGPRASKLAPILAFLALFTALWLAYFQGAAAWRSQVSSHTFHYVNLGFVLAALGLMLSYRVVRWELRRRDRNRKANGLLIGIDVDGVLGNQIVGLLPRIKARLGRELKYEDITDWELALGQSDIKQEILAAELEDRDYVLRMPVHPGGRKLLDDLYPHHRVMVLTSRPPEIRGLTEQWLERSRLSFDELKSLADMKKSAWATDILIDDYLGNVREYLSNTNGRAVLVDQPWNRDRDEVRDWIKNGRLSTVIHLNQVRPIIESVTTEHAKRLPTDRGHHLSISSAWSRLTRKRQKTQMPPDEKG